LRFRRVANHRFQSTAFALPLNRSVKSGECSPRLTQLTPSSPGSPPLAGEPEPCVGECDIRFKFRLQEQAGSCRQHLPRPILLPMSPRQPTPESTWNPDGDGKRRSELAGLFPSLPSSLSVHAAIRHQFHWPCALGNKCRSDPVISATAAGNVKRRTEACSKLLCELVHSMPLAYPEPTLSPTLRRYILTL
jgi:hypothetical protein